METIDFQQERTFQLWRYHVSHSQLLIRSNRNIHAGFPERIDLLFKGVSFVQMPSRFTADHLRMECDPESEIWRTLGIEFHQNRKIYSMWKGREPAGYMCALMVLYVHEEKDHFVPSSSPDINWMLGHEMEVSADHDAE